jgi:hypothetical protein
MSKKSPLSPSTVQFICKHLKLWNISLSFFGVGIIKNKITSDPMEHFTTLGHPLLGETFWWEKKNAPEIVAP